MIKKLVRPNILAMKAYSSARHEFTGKASIFLDANESPFGNGLNRYPDPIQQEVLDKLAQLKNVDTDQIVLGNGSDEIIDLVLRVFCEPRVDHIIACPPTYGMYRVSASINQVEVKEQPLTPAFELNVQGIKDTSNANSKVLFLCSPNNPTGNALSASDIENLLKNFRGIVFVDEAYIDFAPSKSILPLIKKYPNLVVSQTFSKARGRAGIRLGVAYASKEIIRLLRKIKPPYNINDLTAQAALTQLNDADFESDRTYIIQERNRLQEALEAMPMVQKVYPSEANFLLVKFDQANLRYQQLLEAGIVVRNRSSQLHCENCLRITIGTIEENDQFLQTLKLLK